MSKEAAITTTFITSMLILGLTISGLAGKIGTDVVVVVLIWIVGTVVATFSIKN